MSDRAFARVLGVIGLVIGSLACGAPAAPSTTPAAKGAPATKGAPALAPLRPLGEAQAADFRAAFEAAPGKTRILAAFSPT